MKKVLGIDVGATGIKGALVDVEIGELITDRIKYPTPKPATPKAVIETIGQLVKDFDWKDKIIGIGFPAIIKRGVPKSASNISDDFINYKLLKALKRKYSKKIVLLNDADVAGVAEMHYGRGKKAKENVIILLTLGTGIGSAIFVDRQLLPNTELGHLKYKKSVTEKYASNSARENKKLSYQEWGKELDHVLNYINFIFSPDLIILGGGVSKKFKNYESYLSLRHKVEPAKLLNEAGIIGAAYSAYWQFKK